MVFSNRFDPDDSMHRILVLVQMFAVLLMSVFVGSALAEGMMGFALSYFAVRMLLITMYWRVYLSVPELRRVVRNFIVGFSLGAMCWCLSVFFTSSITYFLWALGLMIDFATPWLSKGILTKVSVHRSHLPERLGLFTIIVLGESVLGIVDGLQATSWTINTTLAALVGFILLASIWWLYFESLEHSIMGAELRSGQLAIYGHLPVYMGLVTIAAAVRQSIIGEIPANEATWLLYGGLFMFLLPLQVIHGFILQGVPLKRFVIRNTVLGCLLLILGIIGQHVLHDKIFVIITLIFCVYVFVESRYGLLVPAQ